MEMSAVHDLLSEHQRIEEAIRCELIDIFDEMPENEDIIKISAGPYTYKIPVKTVSKYDVWGPDFYDFPQQWQRMQKILRSGDSLSDQLKKLETIAATKKLQVTENGQKKTIPFHPAVANRLQTILKGA